MSGCTYQVRLQPFGTWVSCEFEAGHDAPSQHSWSCPGSSVFVMAPAQQDVRNTAKPDDTDADLRAGDGHIFDSLRGEFDRRHGRITPERQLAVVRELAANYHDGLVSAGIAMDAIAAAMVL